MAGTITALTVQKKNKERVNIYLDGAFALAVSLNAALTLKKGQHLTDQHIARLKYNDRLDTAYRRSLNYLSYRARTQHEVAQYLQKKETPEAIITRVIERLAAHNYLNDAEFGRAWVETRSRLNPKGKQALRFELKRKGLGEQDITQALSDLNENTLAWQAITKKLPQWQRLDKANFRKKLTGYLTRRGFNYQTINATLARAWQERPPDVDP
ncbi:MAG: RecX family transcriptional regulator [Anaerolineae bacterium]